MLKKYIRLIALIIVAILLIYQLSPKTDTGTATCSHPLAPLDGAELPYNMDLVTFYFSETDGAAYYHLNIETPTGDLITFELDGPKANRFLPTFSEPGKNSWYVDVFNEQGDLICTSISFIYTSIEEEVPAEILTTTPTLTPTPTDTPTLTPSPTNTPTWGELDDDGDGVLNAADSCPQKYADTSDGCPQSDGGGADDEKPSDGTTGGDEKPPTTDD